MAGGIGGGESSRGEEVQTGPCSGGWEICPQHVPAPKPSPPPRLTFSKCWWENPPSISVWDALDSSFSCRRKQRFLPVTSEWGRRTVLKTFCTSRGVLSQPNKLTHLLNRWSAYWKLTWEESQSQGRGTKAGRPTNFLSLPGIPRRQHHSACCFWVLAVAYMSWIKCHVCVPRPLPNCQTLQKLSVSVWTMMRCFHKSLGTVTLHDSSEHVHSTSCLPCWSSGVWATQNPWHWASALLSPWCVHTPTLSARARTGISWNQQPASPLPKSVSQRCPWLPRTPFQQGCW